MVLNTIYHFISENAIFNIVKNNYIYNLSWEDPEVDIKIYGPFKDKNISMITTGGDNVLDYLIEDPNSITTYDLNKHQNWLLELKIACLKCLSREDCLEIFGKGNGELFRNNWNNIKKYLSTDASVWWEKNINVMNNFLFSGSISLIATFFWFFTRIFGMRDSLDTMNIRKDMNYQIEVYDKYKSKLLFMSKVADTLLYYCIAFVGVPVRQYKMIETSNLITELVNYLFTQTNLAKDNYFYWGYIYGKWNDECCPRYLKKEYFDIVKNRLDRITIHTGYLGDPNMNSKFTNDIYVLLDHMDWLDDLTIKKEINSLIDNSSPDCKFCWRSASPKQPFGCLKNGKYIHSSKIGRVYVNDYSDRVGMYDSIHVASFDKKLLLSNTKDYEYSFFNDLKTQIKLFFYPIKMKFSKKNSNKELLELFYENQSDDYDSFRSRMLHGKKHLVHMIPFEEDKSLCLFAGGTGDILENILEIVPKLKEIDVMDICDSLLEQSKKRINNHNWINVKNIKYDAHEFIEKEKYDYIIITYSLTMIPQWEIALDNAIKSLKPGGYLAVSDFTIDNSQFEFSKYFWKKLFSYDNVNLNYDHRYILSKKLSEVRVILEYGTFPNMPTLIKCPYFYGLYQK